MSNIFLILRTQILNITQIMNIELISEEILIDNEELTTWKLDKGNGTIITDLTKLLDLEIIECNWLDDTRKHLIVMHSEYDSMEHFAIVSNEGRLVKKGIKEIHQVIQKEELFVVLFSGFGLGEEDSTYYNVGHEDFKMAVIDEYGVYVLPPQYNSIKYYDDEDVLYADGSIYDFKGNFIKKEE